MTTQRLVIDRLGHRGEGVAHVDDRRVFVPYALAGETVLADVDGDHARLVEIVEASPDRIAPCCPHYGDCGGCAVQTLAPPAYAQWKRELVVTALRNAGLDFEVEPLIDAHGAGRRRVTFHARMDNGKARVGFMAARSHEIVEIGACPLLASDLVGALPAARALAQTLAAHGKPLDLLFTATLTGLDVDLRGAGALDERELRALIAVAEAHDIARLSNHGRLVVMRRTPRLAVGAVFVTPPPSAFLQATQEGEAALAALVGEAAGEAKRAADLFCGLGAFALRLASRLRLLAHDSDAGAIEAMLTAARATGNLHPLTATARDLFKRPLDARELSEVDLVVFDPPRAGAQAQAQEIARSTAATVVAVSCNAQSFARDAGILLAGGYAPHKVTPIDQFRFSPHVEVVAAFSRPRLRAGRRRALFG